MTTEKSKGLREFWIDIRDNFDAEVVHYEKPNHVQGELIHVIEHSQDYESAVQGMREALEYYAKEIEYKEVESIQNFCADSCQPGCNKHNQTVRVKTKSAGHGMNKARQALAAFKEFT